MAFFKFRRTQPLSIQEAVEKRMKDSSVILLDVRTQEEYQSSHLPNSQNIALDQLSEMNLTNIPKDTKIYVYCQSGVRSQQACGKLTKMGYHDVTNIGGIIYWNGITERG